ncbi:MAG: putative manganese-dependent inorganic diphosphatase [Lachnospiraceae bacterium]|nr:putative manganese-dependent inorganic diphosphatase [Lachnospiraceae bacterium]MCI9149910.1 putative manganese-dependent inorganic diphosphatase [Lachnospiraceae bacterium]
MERDKKIWVIGHKNPDTDSICAAIAYTDLKNKLGEGRYESKRAGQLNEETKYVLDYFKVPAPGYVADVGAQVKDIEIRTTGGVSNHISMKKAWELMKEENVVTLPVTTEQGQLEGLIITGDIATSYMDVYDNEILARARTQYKNIKETVEGTLLEGNEHGYFVKGKVVVAAASPEMMEEYITDDDLVILGNRYEVQLCALEMNASCLIVCSGSPVSKTIRKMAAERGCVVISTPYDTFTVARLINQSIPIKYFMRREHLVTFGTEEYVDAVKEVMSKERHRDFPILDPDGRYVGMISRRNLLNMKKKQVILVDHNERSQAVDGIGGAEILEIIDHHRLGSLETISPVFFRNQPLGCTSTIIYQMYQEKGIAITEKIAGLLCSAIISDTLMFRSPTCTPMDRQAAEALAQIAGIQIEEHAKNMFQAGSDFKSKSPEEIFYQDFKTFFAAEMEFGVCQISAMSQEELRDVEEKLTPYLERVLSERKLSMVYVMLTNILEESTWLIYQGGNARRIAEGAFHVRQAEGAGGLELRGVVSRKKQFIPAIMISMQEE